MIIVASNWRNVGFIYHIAGNNYVDTVTATRNAWSSTECNQPATWTMNRSLFVASRVKAFPGRPTNSDSILPRTVHLDGGVIVCYQCITSHKGNAPASLDMRPTPMALSRMHTIHHLHPCSHPIQYSHD